MIKVKQKALAAVEKSQAEDVVVQECKEGTDNNIDRAKAAFATRERHPSPERRIVIHVADVAVERGVGVVDEIACEAAGRAVEFCILMYQAGFELRRPAAKKAKFGVGVKASAAHEPSEEHVAARNEVTVMGGPTADHIFDIALELGRDFFVGVQTQDPVACGFLQRRIFLCGVAFPRLDPDLSAIACGDFDRAVCGTGIDDNDFVSPLYAFERARQVRFFVERNDDDGERHEEMVIGQPGIG